MDARVSSGVGFELQPSSLISNVSSLDGLRLFAALFVLLGHSSSSILTLSPQPTHLVWFLQILVPVGMSLFFTLSGFVIHYNYSRSVLNGIEGVASFLIARFARLVPLYMLFVLVSLAVAWKENDFPVAYYYLAMAQSWVYVQYDGLSLLSHLRTLPVTWSISTEWFLYCLYPFLAFLLVRKGAIFVAFLTLAYMAILSLGYLHPELIDGPALAWWGPAAVDRSNGNNLFYAWVLNFSPLGRLHEFLAGVLAAHLYLLRRDDQARAFMGYLLTFMAIAVLVAMYGGLQAAWLAEWRRWINAASVFVIPCGIALFIFSIARYRTVFAVFFRSRPVAGAGDATYSIYLFHLTAIQIAAIGGPIPSTWSNVGLVGARYAALLTMLILISLGIYRAYEAPMRSFIRRKIDGRNRARAVAVIVVFPLIPGLAAAYGWAVSFGFIR